MEQDNTRVKANLNGSLQELKTGQVCADDLSSKAVVREVKLTGALPVTAGQGLGCEDKVGGAGSGARGEYLGRRHESKA
jgi:hypothetical protein